MEHACAKEGTKEGPSGPHGDFASETENQLSKTTACRFVDTMPLLAAEDIRFRLLLLALIPFLSHPLSKR